MLQKKKMPRNFAKGFPAGTSDMYIRKGCTTCHWISN